ncbi:MAG TPA: hypothetical protein VFW47_11045, partial [Phenylobacterium sp.]|nr:hypothetical protein [Phenylobacterium sp.]
RGKRKGLLLGKIKINSTYWNAAQLCRAADGVLDLGLSVRLAELRACRDRLAVHVEHTPRPAAIFVADRVGEGQFGHYGLALCIAAI